MHPTAFCSNASRLTNITYRNQTTTYTRDTANRLSAKTLPNGIRQELSYDGADRLLSLTYKKTDVSVIKTITYTYDAKGQSLSKSHSGNSRRVPGVSGGFKYDVLNRRVEKTINGNTVNFIYDGAQAIAEITNGSVSAAILTGLHIDEVLARYSSNGNRTYLTDGLGSVIAQANDTQAIENYYAYTPYGETQALGADQGNAINKPPARTTAGSTLY